MSALPDSAATALRIAAALCGGAAALLYFSLLVWTARDVSARSRDGLVRLVAVALVLLLNAFGLLIYVLLRPRETIAERYERELVEEILVREVSAAALARSVAGRARLPGTGEG